MLNSWKSWVAISVFLINKLSCSQLLCIIRHTKIHQEARAPFLCFCACKFSGELVTTAHHFTLLVTSLNQKSVLLSYIASLFCKIKWWVVAARRRFLKAVCTRFEDFVGKLSSTPDKKVRKNFVSLVPRAGVGVKFLIATPLAVWL